MIAKDKDRGRQDAGGRREGGGDRDHQGGGVRRDQDSAERDLAEALPALDAAVAVLKNLKLSDLSEAAKYANPPGGVKLTWRRCACSRA